MLAALNIDHPRMSAAVFLVVLIVVLSAVSPSLAVSVVGAIIGLVLIRVEWRFFRRRGR